MVTNELRAEIERELKRKLVAAAPLSAANNAQIYRLGLEGGKSVVAKIAQKGLDIEAFMLKYLREHSPLPVPTIHYSNDHVIIMDFVETYFSVDDKAQRHAAELLAALHGVKGPSFGFTRDTSIGGIRQPNPQGEDWSAFYAEHRLIYMAKGALEDGKIDAKMMNQIEKLAGKLKSYLPRPQPPALIHGDIWGGNILFGQGRVAAFLDPAIYYADPEIELAMIALFNTLNDSFFARYNDLRPIAPEFFELRAPIYSIYPLLVHARLFGSSYVRKVQKALDRFAG